MDKVYYITDGVDTYNGTAIVTISVNKKQLKKLLKKRMIYENTTGDSDENPYVGVHGSKRHFHPMHEKGATTLDIVEWVLFGPGQKLNRD